MLLLAVAVIVPLVLLVAALVGPGLVDRVERRRELVEAQRDSVVARTAPYRLVESPGPRGPSPAAVLPALEPLDDRRALASFLVAEAPVLEAPALVQKPRH